MLHYSRDLQKPLIRDHLDDLESFFYVFTHIIHAYDRNGVFYPLDDDSKLNLWDKYEGKFAATVKRTFLAVSSTPDDITLRWPEACIRVLHRFQDFLRDIVRKKMGIILKPSANPVDIQKPLQLSAEDHYDHILRLFDEGIGTLEIEDTAESLGPTPPFPGALSLRPSTERSALKRAPDDDPDGQPAAKRANPPPVVRNSHCSNCGSA
jgi:hypothetical protein